MWGVTLSWSKMLAEPVERILYEYSWQNLILYGAATPSYDDVKEDKPRWDDRFDMCDPKNINNNLEDEYV